MFGNMFGDLEEKQKALQEKLAGIVIDESAAGGKLSISVNARREVLNISIDPELAADPEQLEDMLVITMNKALQSATAVEVEEGQKLMKDMLPPGLDKLF